MRKLALFQNAAAFTVGAMIHELNIYQKHDSKRIILRFVHYINVSLQISNQCLIDQQFRKLKSFTDR